MSKKKKFIMLIAIAVAVCAAAALGLTVNQGSQAPASAAYSFSYTSSAEGLTLTAYTGSGTEVVIPETINGIPVVALSNTLFTDNTAIQTVIIPKTVNLIGSYGHTTTFQGCTNLASFTVDAANDYYMSDNGVLYSKINGEPTTLLWYPAKKINTSYTVKADTKYIAAVAAKGNTYLQSLSLQTDLLQIGISAFEGCTALTTVNIPASIQYVGYRSFANTAITAAGLTISADSFSLSSDAFINTPIYNAATNNAVYYDDNWALGVKGSLTGSSFSLAAGTKGFAGGMFAGNFDLTSVTLPNSVKAIPDYAFANCIALEGISIPNGLTYLGRSAFQNCTALTSLSLSGTAITALLNETFLNCSSLASVSLPSTLQSIQYDTFLGSKIISSAPNGIIKADSWVIAGKGNYASADFSGVVGIANQALSGSYLTSVSLPATVKYIGESAFANSIHISSLTINGTASLAMGSYAFSGLSALASLDLNGVTAISDYAFADSMTAANATITNTSSLESIGNYAFSGCTKLLSTSFTIPASVSSIGYYAFQNTGLYNAAANGIVYKDNWALDYKGSRTASEVAFASGTVGLAGCVLSKFESLTAIDIPSSIKYIGTHAFYRCTALTQITLPASLQAIGDYAFFMCRSLTDIMFIRAESVITQSGEGLLYNSFDANVYVRPVSENAYVTDQSWQLYSQRIYPLAEVSVSTGSTGGSTTPATYYLFPNYPTSISTVAAVETNYYFQGWTVNGDYYAYIPNTSYNNPDIAGGTYAIKTNCSVIGGDYTVSFIYNGSGQGAAASDIASRTVAHQYTSTGYSSAAKPINEGSYTYNVSVYYNNTLVGSIQPISFSIIPKDLVSDYWISSIQQDYQFCGSRILPIPIVNDTQLGVLTEGRDYSVTYGQNYSAATGGTIEILGLGNYKTKTVASFDITKSPQSVAFLSLKYNNTGRVNLEELQPQHSDFELAFLPSLGYDGNYITLYAYTTAIYTEDFTPSAHDGNVSQMQVKKLAFNIDSAFTPSTPARLEYISWELEQQGGVWYSKTTARLYMSNLDEIVQYGLNTITVSPAAEDSNYRHIGFDSMPTPVDDGYVQDFGTQDSTPFTHIIFFKKEHTVGGSFLSDIVKTYGDPAFYLEAGLNSGLTDFIITSGNPDIISISGDTGLTRKATINNAGEDTVITLTHTGVTDLISPSNSYTKVQASININVLKAELSVYPAQKTVIYGTAPDYSNIATSYNFLGFKYFDSPAMVLSITSGYNSQEMKNSGTYYLTADKLVLDSQYENYNVYYVPDGGILTVSKKTLIASINDASKVYGAAMPAFNITYTGFIPNETPSNALEFEPAYVQYGGANEFSNVGDHTISLAGGYARNYTIDTKDTAKLTVTPADVSIHLNPKTADYTARSCLSNTPIILGLEGGSIPSGVYNIYYYINGEFTTTASPVNAGSYTVKIEYLSIGEDNYKNNFKVFADNINILPIAPHFTLNAIDVDYSASDYTDIPLLTAVGPGAANGSNPAGTLSFMYSYNDGEFTDAMPKDSGIYTVKVTYSLAPGTVDNYIGGSYYIFNNVLTINTVFVSSIDLQAAVATYQSTNGTTPDTLPANQAVAHGVAKEYTLDASKYPHQFIYRYYVDGQWQSEAPFNEGNYNVEVTFYPLNPLNYKQTTHIFENAVRILPALPNIYLDAKTSDYTGKRIAQNEAAVTGIPGGSQPIGSIEYLFAPHGSIVFTKDAVVNVNYTNGENTGYDVLVRFTSKTGSNYQDYEKYFYSAIIINPIVPRIVMAAASANFTGSPYDIAKMPAYLSGITGGSTPIGNISYKFSTDGQVWADIPPINAGEYSVSAVFTPAVISIDNTHNNYKPTSTVFAKALTINKVAPILSILPQKVDYTGNPAYLSIANGDVKATGINASYPPEGSLSLQYFINDVWSNQGAVQSGSYKVKVIYTATETENYIGYERIFNNAITVLNIEPLFADILAYTYIFDGQRPTPQYDLAIIGEAGKGILSVNYKVGSSWTSRAPTDQGIYPIRIVYTAASKDNYKSAMKEYPDMLIIKPRDLYITPKAEQSKVFDYQAINNIEYTLLGLLDSDTLIGSLSAGINTNAGRYAITRGSLQIDITGKASTYADNYNIIFDGSCTYAIMPAEVELTFSAVAQSQLVYSPGDKKSKYIEVKSWFNNNEIATDKLIIGDDISVGEFTVMARIYEENFVLPPDNTRTYTITSAQMPVEENLFNNASYSYSGMPYVFEASRILDGAVITYYYNNNAYDKPLEFTSTGEYTVEAYIAKENYSAVTLSATLKIHKAVPYVIAAPYDQPLVFGDSLPAIRCNNTDGTILLDAGQQLIPGTYDYRWTFTPNDTDNYEVIRGLISLRVSKAATNIHTDGLSIQDAGNPQKYSAWVTSTLGDVQGKIVIRYYDSLGNEYLNLPSAAGKYTMLVTFEGDDNYAASTYSTIITIQEKADFGWLYILIGALAGLGILAGIVNALRRARG